MAEPQQQQTYTVKKLGQKGYCEDWKYLPGACECLLPLTSLSADLCSCAAEGKYPKQLNKGGDAVQECAMRCSKSFGKQQAFYLRDKDSTCACSKGQCKKVTKSGSYTSYEITKHPGSCTCIANN